MDLHQLRCFVLAAEELHFGRAAQKIDLLPSAFGRFIRLLEEDLGAKLFIRTTRSVVLTEEGRTLLGDAKRLLVQADEIRAKFQTERRAKATKLKVGAVDSAAVGLLPLLLNDFRARRPDVEVELFEDKTTRLLPRILSGRLDMAFVRPPPSPPPSLTFRHLFHETPILAINAQNPLSRRKTLSIVDIGTQSLIVPDRRSRPHSHDLTIRLFEEAGIEPRIAQVADEKQTIVNLVSAGLGIAIVPKWMSRMTLPGVSYVKLKLDAATLTGRLPLAAVWVKGSRDALRDDLLSTLDENIDRYVKEA